MKIQTTFVKTKSREIRLKPLKPEIYIFIMGAIMGAIIMGAIMGAIFINSALHQIWHDYSP